MIFDTSELSYFASFIRAMNYKGIYIFAELLMALAMFSCSAKKEAREPGHHRPPDEAEEWTQMDDFHMIMAETFHPYKDSANLEPVKARAMELLKYADQWLIAPLPAQVDTEEVKARLKEIRADAQKLAESVKSSDDNKIAEHLTRLHDTFHELQEHWYEGGRHTGTPSHQH